MNISAKKSSYAGKITGLMFRSRNAGNLLFFFKKDVNLSIHSFFVFFNFLAIWLDRENNALGAEIIKPFTLSVKPVFSFRKIIEVPCSAENKWFIGEVLKSVGKRKV